MYLKTILAKQSLHQDFHLNFAHQLYVQFVFFFVPLQCQPRVFVVELCEGCGKSYKLRGIGGQHLHREHGLHQMCRSGHRMIVAQNIADTGLREATYDSNITTT